MVCDTSSRYRLETAVVSLMTRLSPLAGGMLLLQLLGMLQYAAPPLVVLIQMAVAAWRAEAPASRRTAAPLSALEEAGPGRS